MDHVTYILFTTGIRMDEYHPWYGLTRLQDSTGTPCDARTGIIWALHGNLHVFHILRGPYVTRKGAVQRPYGQVRELTQP